MTEASDKPRILTGDTPTGRLHLGHYVGSLENRLALQETSDCFFLIANVHALSTRHRETEAMRADTWEIVCDYLSAGIDPSKSTIFLQSECPAIPELTWYFAMLIGHGRLMRNPTLKDELATKDLGENCPFGFVMYPVGQVADILAFRPSAVPVGEDQVPHIEMTRELARRFNALYCAVDPQAGDAAHAAQGVFPVPEAQVGRVPRLLGTDGQHKMSKSMNNAIYLSDDAKTVEKKCKRIHTGRMSATDPGVIEGNPLWQLHDAFNPDAEELATLKQQYQAGEVGDGECKKRLAAVINETLEPIRAWRGHYENHPDEVWEVLRQGTRHANAVAEKTLQRAKEAMRMDFFSRSLEM
jgi:tryptophanyl-tRNA synthetase